MNNQVDLVLTSANWRSTPDGMIHFWTSIRTDSPIPVEQLRQGDYSQIPDNWTAVLLSSAGATLVSDRVRSHALLYGWSGESWIITDSPDHLQSSLETWAINTEQAALFPHLGFSVGPDTLIAGVRTVQAGSSVDLDTDSSEDRISFYGAHRFSHERHEDEAEYSELFTSMLDETIGRVIEQAAGRQLAIPLSGGIDSRLLLLWLKRLGAPNVIAFTYGVPQSTEAAVSSRTAALLETPWFMIETDPLAIRNAWFSHEADAFMSATWAGTSLPHVQDWYALRKIRENSLLEEDAIILPGHTIVGNLHDENLLDETPGKDQVNDALRRHHGSHSSPRRGFVSSVPFREAIDSAFEEAGFDDSTASLHASIEWFNLRERQAKYINNSMRGYEFFGWDWAIPMATADAFEAWSRGGQVFTTTRDWYQRFTDREFAAVTGSDVSYFTAPSAPVPPKLKRVLLKIMRSLRLDRVLSQLRSTRSMLNHPMGFDGFIRDRNRLRVGLRMLGGQTTISLWANDFLHNKWGSSECAIVPPMR